MLVLLWCCRCVVGAAFVAAVLEHGICSKAADVYSFGVLLFQVTAHTMHTLRAGV